MVDAHGCDPAALRSPAVLGALFARIVREMGLHPVGEPLWHVFPGPGGITGVVILSESHLACHTFPEFGSVCVNVFCCRARDDFDAAGLMTEMLRATSTHVRRVEREYGPLEPHPA
jgi:S-adenosylmethionine decarboxylase